MSYGEHRVSLHRLSLGPKVIRQRLPLDAVLHQRVYTRHRETELGRQRIDLHHKRTRLNFHVNRR